MFFRTLEESLLDGRSVKVLGLSRCMDILSRLSGLFLIRVNPFEISTVKLSFGCHNFFCGAATQRGSWPPHFLRFLDHTQRRTTVGRTPLDE